MNKITSKCNEKIKNLVKLSKNSKFRNEKLLFYVEGERIIKDTPLHLIENIFIKESKIDKYKYIYNKIDSSKVYSISDNVYEKICDTKNSQGIIAVIKYNYLNDLSYTFLKSINSCIILDSINDPGNLGTIIRLSEAANISLILLCNNCCDVFNNKAIRSSMSSVFRVPIYISKNVIEDIKKIKKSGLTIYSTTLDSNSIIYNSIKYNIKTAFIFGNEANGVSDEVNKLADNNIYIPMCGKIQSLNVAMAASIICYEYMNQFKFYET